MQGPISSVPEAVQRGLLMSLKQAISRAYVVRTLCVPGKSTWNDRVDIHGKADPRSKVAGYTQKLEDRMYEVHT